MTTKKKIDKKQYITDALARQYWEGIATDFRHRYAETKEQREARQRENYRIRFER